MDNPNFPHQAVVLVRYEMGERMPNGYTKPGKIDSRTIVINGLTAEETQAKLTKLLEIINEFKQTECKSAHVNDATVVKN